MIIETLRTAKAISDGPPVGQTPHDIVHRENKLQLLRFRAPGPRRKQTPVLIVPSLINKWYILDLLPEQSFVGFLVEQGHDVFIIDWGAPGPEDKHVSLEHYVERYIGRCARVAARLAGADNVHLLGYCLGGTLTVLHAALFPENVASMVTLAAPIAFDDDGMLTQWMNVDGFNVAALADATGNIPWPIMQAAFHMLKPMLNFAKMRTVMERGMDDKWLRIFAAIETWGNDNVSFAGDAFRTYIRQLYQNNALVNGGLSMSGREVRLSEITCPLMVVSFSGDHIVPERSARALVELAGSEVKEDLLMPGGHVGAVIGKRARHGLWRQISDFYFAHGDHPGPRALPEDVTPAAAPA